MFGVKFSKHWSLSFRGRSFWWWSSFGLIVAEIWTFDVSGMCNPAAHRHMALAAAVSPSPEFMLRISVRFNIIAPRSNIKGPGSNMIGPGYNIMVSGSKIIWPGPIL